MTDSKFRTKLQEYTKGPIISVTAEYDCAVSDRFKSYGLRNLWNRVVLHSISQNGEEWFKNAVVDNEPLCALFDWHCTEEGYTFWKKVYIEICGGTPE